VIDNAFKCTPDGGQISLEARHECEMMRIISDTGTGIDRAYREGLFQKIPALDDGAWHTTSRTSVRGSGRGLAATHGSVRAGRAHLG
jgi:signal transduction histidine kinase